MIIIQYFIVPHRLIQPLQHFYEGKRCQGIKISVREEVDFNVPVQALNVSQG